MLFDIALTSDGYWDYPLRPVTDEDLILQRIKVRLRTHPGDYVLDQSLFVPWLSMFDQKGTAEDRATFAALLRSVVSGVRGVAACRGSVVTLEGSTLRWTSEIVLEETQADRQIVADFGRGARLADPLSLLRITWAI